MLVHHLRSSSYGAFDWCEHKYLIEYVWGTKSPSGKAADVGNVVHKALELLARQKLAVQLGQETFSDDELGFSYPAGSVTPEVALDSGYRHYSTLQTHHEWTDEDRDLAWQYLQHTLNFNGGMFDPRLRDVVEPELFFDIELPYDWAEYEQYDPYLQKMVRGRHGVKGTMDLLTRIRPGLLELVDWKTGARKNWITHAEKSLDSLHKDFQLLLYFWVLCRLYPNDDIVVTIFYVRDGGPFTLSLTRDKHLPLVVDMMRDRFAEIRRTQAPSRILGKPRDHWRCERLCHFFRTEHEPGTSQCEHFYQEVVQLGLDRATAKHGRPGAWKSYGSGGGVQNRDGEVASVARA